MGDELHDIEGTFTKKAGPFPVWVWAVLIGGIATLVFWLYRRNSGTTTSTSASTDAVNNESSSGLSALGYGTDTSLGGSDDASTALANNNPIYPQTSTISDNSTWVNTAGPAIAKQLGASPSAVISALDAYIGGDDYTATQQKYIDAAIQAYGAPPGGGGGGSVIPASTSTSTSTTTTTPAKTSTTTTPAKTSTTTTTPAKTSTTTTTPAKTTTTVAKSTTPGPNSIATQIVIGEVTGSYAAGQLQLHVAVNTVNAPSNYSHVTNGVITVNRNGHVSINYRGGTATVKIPKSMLTHGTTDTFTVTYTPSGSSSPYKASKATFARAE